MGYSTLDTTDVLGHVDGLVSLSAGAVGFVIRKSPDGWICDNGISVSF